MFPLIRMAPIVVLLACAVACATATAPVSHDGDGYPDTEWGDEYEGLHIDRDADRSEKGLHAEWVEGDTRTVRADARVDELGVRVRRTETEETGSVAWHGTGVIGEIIAGHVSPASADGVLVGDSRTGSDLRAPASVGTSGLRLAPSVSPVTEGGGGVVAMKHVRAAVGAWKLDDREDRVGFASIEHRRAASTIGIAGGVAQPDGLAAFSLFASHDSGDAFTSGEIAAASGRVRAVARVVAGARREWSAIALAGAGPVDDRPLVFTRRERWGAALERRDAWGWGASRAGVSSLTRRDAATEVRRRRAFWNGIWEVSAGARVELAARITREESGHVAAGALAALPARGVTDDWRVRATLRTRHVQREGWALGNAYRLEWVQNRSGRPGTLATWTGSIQAGPVDGRFSASAHALHRGQVAWTPDLSPPGSFEYAAVSGRGASMTGTLKLRLGLHAWIGARWSKQPPVAARLWITAGLRV